MTSLEGMSCLVDHDICNSSVPCMDDGWFQGWETVSSFLFALKGWEAVSSFLFALSELQAKP